MGRIIMVEHNNFKTRGELDHALADKVSEILQQAIEVNGKATMAVSGGSTPKGFFKVLSTKKINWHKVTITLADERWVEINSNDSNARLIHENLIQNRALLANFISLKQEGVLCESTLSGLNTVVNDAILPLDVLILGMGEDGHTASLFPCSSQIKMALDSNNQNALIAIKPTTAPYLRITFSFSALSQSNHTFLHLCGQSKKEVLEKALKGSDVLKMPIRKFLHASNINTQIYWAE